MNTKKKVIVCDIDGVLADNSHRQKYLLENPKDYKVFYDGMMEDKVNEFIKNFLTIITEIKKYDLIFLTGRLGEYRVLTEQWLSYTGLTYSDLYMRYSENYIESSEFKMLTLKTIMEDFEIKMVIDDDENTISKAKDLGLNTFHYHIGDELTQPNWRLAWQALE